MMKVLLLEDDSWLADSYRRVLESGFEVHLATSAEAAIRKIEEQIPDVIVADVMLEGHTALALLNELQSYDDTGQIPIILCSALDSESFWGVDLSQYGVKLVLDKAKLEPNELVSAVQGVLM